MPLNAKKALFRKEKGLFKLVRPPGLEPIFVISLLSITYKENQSLGA
jgi:hypothetical protein